MQLKSSVYLPVPIGTSMVVISGLVSCEMLRIKPSCGLQISGINPEPEYRGISN